MIRAVISGVGQRRALIESFVIFRGSDQRRSQRAARVRERGSLGDGGHRHDDGDGNSNDGAQGEGQGRSSRN